VVGHARISLALILTIAAATLGHAEQRNCLDGPKPPNLRVRSWKVDTRWGNTPLLSEAFTAESAYSEEKVSLAIREVRAATLPQAFREFDKGGVAVLFVDSCVVQVDTEHVDVFITPHLVRVDVMNVGSNVLPVPRFNKAAEPQHIPSLTDKLTPTVGIEQDRKAGLSQKLDLSTDLLTLAKSGSEFSPAVNQLVVEANGAKSLNRRFYDGTLRLTLSHQRPQSLLSGIALISGFRAERQPLGPQELLQNAGRTGVLLTFNPHSGIMRKAIVSGLYRRSRDRVFATSTVQGTSENGFEVRAVSDLRVFAGIGRIAAWVDGGNLIQSDSSYKRLSVRSGYAVNVPVPGTKQTFGIETLFGAGRQLGTAPNYRLFFGGNQGASFLYENPASTKIADLPGGPILRSYGTAQAGGGDDRFWHFNLNVSVPIPKWSQPLIPDVETPVGSLSDLIKSQAVNSAESFLESFYENQGLSADQAKKRAGSDMREIKPAVRYLADLAKIYALKPLFLYDAARIDGRTRNAVGGGLQLTIVLARFEAGYMATIKRLSDESRGNFIMRITFDNLF
jgi:hypothetical protein